MPLTICMALVQRRLPRKCTAQVFGSAGAPSCWVIAWFPPWQSPTPLSCKFRFGGISVRRASTHMRPTLTWSQIVASVEQLAATPKRLRRLLFPVPLSRYPAAPGLTSERGRSSVVERQLPKLYVEGSIPFARSNSLRRHHFSPASGKITPASVVICEAGGRSYAAAENRLPIGNVDGHDPWGFWARSRRCVVQESCEAMSNESVSCSIFKSNQDQRRGYRAASGIQWKPCRSGRTNSLFWALGSGERPGNRRQRFCETDPMASGFGILGKTQ